MIAVGLIGPALYGQGAGFHSQEIDDDGVPVILKHLPDWESVRSQALVTNSADELKGRLGDRTVLGVFQMEPGTEAATAGYPEGQLLIVEFPTPQAATAADDAVKQLLTGSPAPDTVYQRTGNYGVFVFGVSDPEAGLALAQRVRYEKSVQWLGDDPYLVNRIQRYLVGSSADMLVSTVVFIVLCLGASITGGVLIGFIYFRMRLGRKAEQIAFSDGGGLTRLNLDGLTATTNLKKSSHKN